MDVSRQQEVEGEIPIPINSNNTTNYATNGHHGHMIHHHHHHPHHDPLPAVPLPLPHNNNNNIISSNNSPPVLMNGQVEDDYNHKKVAATVVVRYRECLKNHAASMGGNATDGCGEFMPSGEEGTIEALNCSACNCHRNFHRKEVEGDDHHHHHHHPDSYFHRLHPGTRKFLLAGGGVGTHPHNNNSSSSILPSRTVPPHHHMIMPFNYNIPSLPSESDEQELDHGGGGGVAPSRAPLTHQVVKKRFRTKFTPEQKEKMMSFADKVGWKLQKQEDSVVQHFCQEIGVKRRVLKVWMHNNKHNLAKKINNLPLPLPLPLPPTTTSTTT